MDWVAFIIVGLVGLIVIGIRTFPVWFSVEFIDPNSLSENKYHLWLKYKESESNLHLTLVAFEKLKKENETLKGRIKALQEDLQSQKYLSYTAGYQKGLFHQETPQHQEENNAINR